MNDISPDGIVLALGGGAARGLAHIGVLRALEEDGIPVKAVAGTSMGAIIGSLHILGHNASEIEELVLALDWQKLGRVMLGSLVGTAFHDLLRDLLGPVRIEELDRPFAAVCCDLDTGEEVALRTGPLADAVRASAAIPGLLTPMRLDGRTLADGALAAPVPVAAARALCDGPILAVNVLRLGTPEEPGPSPPVRHQGAPLSAIAARVERWLQRQREVGEAVDDVLPGRWAALERALVIMQQKIAVVQCQGVPTVQPEVSGFGWFDFARASEIIERGKRAYRLAGPCS